MGQQKKTIAATTVMERMLKQSKAGTSREASTFFDVPAFFIYTFDKTVFYL